MLRETLLAFAFAGACVHASAADDGSGCEQEWSALGAGIINEVRALAVFDDGRGPALFAGGSFSRAGGEPAGNVARWDGSRWEEVGGGIDHVVNVLTVFDDGSGPALYAGGYFEAAGGAPAAHIARWNGTAWRPVNGGLDGLVFALAGGAVGSGDSALYAGGTFNRTGAGDQARKVAKWDGERWSRLGDGVDDEVRALAHFDDGSGSALYVGGHFTEAGGVAVDRMAKWDGARWSAVGGGFTHTVVRPEVFALTTFDDGSETALYAGGRFTHAGGVEAASVAKWDGTRWSPVGAGLDSDVFALAVFDDGTGSALYAGGRFDAAGGPTATGIARWNGAEWERVGGGLEAFSEPWVNTIIGWEDGGGAGLYVGGWFEGSGSIDAMNIARWGCTSERCYADCDNDGELSFFDFLCFQNEFAGLTSYADCDASGGHDFFDFLCFQNSFAAGCR